MKKSKTTPEVAFATVMVRLKQAGLPLRRKETRDYEKDDVSIEDIGERIKKLLGIFGTFDKTKNKMIYFIMYDIEHNKIRAHIARYLIRKGCTRVQKSIFLANTDRKMFNELQVTLKSVQEMYENNDSIFFVPVSTDEIKAMKIIGKSIDFELVTGSKNTLFI